jgi:hypothetical protein
MSTQMRYIKSIVTRVTCIFLPDSKELATEQVTESATDRQLSRQLLSSIVSS